MAETIENLLQEMEAYARARQVPILTEAARPVFLRTVRAAAPRRILELGTAIGYSALLALRESPEAEIVTIERDAETAETARGFLRRAGEDYEFRLHRRGEVALSRFLARCAAAFDAAGRRRGGQRAVSRARRGRGQRGMAEAFVSDDGASAS